MRRIRALKRNNTLCAGCTIRTPESCQMVKRTLQDSIGPVFMQYNRPFVSGLRRTQ
jgi:hypothetical protein